jgi:hypothetical protein
MDVKETGCDVADRARFRIIRVLHGISLVLEGRSSRHCSLANHLFVLIKGNKNVEYLPVTHSLSLKT